MDQAQEILLNSTLELLYRFKCVLRLEIDLLRCFKYYFLEIVENIFLESQKLNSNFLAIEKSTSNTSSILFIVIVNYQHFKPYLFTILTFYICEQ